MEERSSWPRTRPITPESVANQLRKLDKGEGHDWWLRGAGKPFLAPLAEVLAMDVSELREHIEMNAGRHADTPGRSLWRFDLFPELRPLNLYEEPLPPGVPEALCRLEGPREDRVWWRALAGANKTMVGRWLDVRLGWRHLEVSTWKEAQRHLPEQGRVFVELKSCEGISDSSQLQIPAHLRICVAAPSRLPWPPALQSDEAQGRVDGWIRIETPPPSTWVHEVIHWAAQRVRPGGGFQAAQVIELFDKQRLQGIFDTPGQLMSFLALIEELGVDVLHDDMEGSTSASMERWLRTWLRKLNERPDRKVPSPVRELITKKGHDVLVEMVRQRMWRGLPPLLLSSEWCNLLPEELAQGIDREQLRNLLEDGSPAAVARARQLLTPGPEEFINGLQTLSVLVPHDGGDALEIAPSWLSRVLETIAFEFLLDGSAADVGALLLNPETVEPTLLELIDSVAANKLDRVTKLLGNIDPAKPEHLAAVDGAFRAIGLALAQGHEVPGGLVNRAWDVQMLYLGYRYRGWPQTPLLTITSLGPGGLTSHAGWFLAALWISFTLVEGHGRDMPASALVPWQGMPPTELTRRAFQEAVHWATDRFRLEDGLSPEWERVGYRLGALLLDRLGILRYGASILEAQIPDLVVLLATKDDAGKGGGQITEQDVREVLRLRCGYDALVDACKRRQVQIDAILTWCWHVWGREPRWEWPPWNWLADSAGNQGPRKGIEHLWRLAPAQTLSEEILTSLDRRVGAWLSRDVWERWLELWLREQHRGSDQASMWAFVPEEFALAAVRDGRVDAHAHEIRKLLWARMPEKLLGLIDELATAAAGISGTGDNPLQELLYSAPAPLLSKVLERAEKWINAREKFVGVGDWLLRWLMYVVEQRFTDWRRGYDLLLVSALPRVNSEP